MEQCFSSHLGNNSARTSCITCNHYWGQRRSLLFALELTKKKPDLRDFNEPDDQ